MPPIAYTIRPATPDDTPQIFALILALAEYEQLSHTVKNSQTALAEHLFGPTPYAEALVADREGQLVGFALFFTNYSTFLTQPGIYLEDLFVLPDHRRQGIGTALFQAIAKLALDRGYGRLEWSVLAWNQPAIDFYRRMGATVLPDWRIARLQSEDLRQLASVNPAIAPR
ncbi:N-acetyltransferase family protein [Trichothermofontia sp.]